MRRIVDLALRRPYTFVVTAILIAILGIVAVTRMAVDIFPAINIPVVTVIWGYSGMAPEEMERRMVTVSERFFTTVVNDIEHIESQSLNGTAVLKLFFHPDADVATAVAQLTASSNTITRAMPPGTQPPSIIRFNATDVPVLKLSIGSDTRPEQELFDVGNNVLRSQLATIRGTSISQPYGGKNRQIMVDIDPALLYAKGLDPSDVSDAFNVQNVALPAGTAKMGDREYNVRLNSSPDVLEQLNDLPVKTVNGRTVYVRDVAQVRDGFTPQSNIVRENGRRAAYISVLKNGAASTLSVVDRVKAALEDVKAKLPPGIDVKLLADQSVFVRASLEGTVREGIIAAVLTALMILLFLGSWRSTLIIATTIPLSILASLIVLYALRQTINVMTLGGFALAVGILVDNGTVAIENVHRRLHDGMPLREAILVGLEQVAKPTLISTLSICIVFVPVFFLTGTAKFLFTPLAMAVIFAVLASYFLSITLLPTMAGYLMRGELAYYGPDGHHRRAFGSFFWRVNAWVDERYERFRDGYRALLVSALENRRSVGLGFAAFCVASVVLLVPFIGQDFFPEVDTGSLMLHLRAPPGTRIEATEQLTAQAERIIRRVVPPSDLSLVLSTIGLTSGSLNVSTANAATVGPADGDVVIILSPERRGRTDDYRRRIRAAIARELPQLTTFYQPADIVSQILNFGLPAAIDVQVAGKDKRASYRLAQQVARRVRRIPGAADVHVHQVMAAPEFLFSVDRDKAQEMGLTQRDVANNLLISLSSSGQTAPNFWINPETGISYRLGVQTPQYRMASLEDLNRTPVAVDHGSASPELFGDLASAQRTTGMAVVNHYDVQPVADVFANAERRDLGGVASDVDRVLQDIRKTLPKGTTITMRGQVASMRASFVGLGLGILFAIGLVYLLLVVNFQSWTDPLIIIAALPGALAGIAWMLFVTRTTLNVPSLIGAIMAVGVATANSVLVVSFANEQRRAGMDATQAALSAGYERLRPVLMTALAMVIGMLPMALGLGEGGEQNAPLGRAVIGGLVLATVATLVFVPIVYSALQGRKPAPRPVEVEP
ncbi:MAG TPA: efflux RND transporter permease subunit [Longimicrobiales bacterium]|nr:efflux RND transporter permease subunit [Longimicrobiales bacterium]